MMTKQEEVSTLRDALEEVCYFISIFASCPYYHSGWQPDGDCENVCKKGMDEECWAIYFIDKKGGRNVD